MVDGIGQLSYRKWLVHASAHRLAEVAHMTRQEMAGLPMFTAFVDIGAMHSDESRL